MLHDCTEQYVPVEKEWKIIEDYVALEKVRYGERVNVFMNRNLNGGGVMIAPLLFLPLAENAFKHGPGSNRNKTEIRIDLKSENGELQFTVENTIDQSEVIDQNSGSIGLQNVKRQLELLYPHHSMRAEKSDGKFIASITLKLNQHADAMPYSGR
jgi:sensor histidine kinase YesM